MRTAPKKILSTIIGLALLLLLAWLQLEPSNSKKTQYSPELRQTLALIQQGGPYPYRQDNSLFHNREKRLPLKPRGYYREYTVPTPNLKHRGAKRVVTGGQPPEVYYYTEDHYQSFIQLKVQP
ncbi:ribonuclease domain-containing protein [Thiopseudomonas alkaliphila]|uniref:ribonuclease domain-containing protein n=1 Tax=Thiopseudomonas alkaliphila TaxID=1697053 RepID=UPI00257756BE|nr:ribonuclease domain-containing protein [Thiopseudomonas alkaliphila]MDM1716416.1 ribonuclease [Thiopseudomonas alkaliphila]